MSADKSSSHQRFSMQIMQPHMDVSEQTAQQPKYTAAESHAHGAKMHELGYQAALRANPTAQPLPEGGRDVIAMLLDVVRLAHDAMDNTEENDHGHHAWNKPDFDALSAAMDKIEALPDDQPGYVMGPAAKAAWALRRSALSAAPLPVATQQPKLIETLKFALLDALGFAELVESYSKPDVEMYKHELRGDSERAQGRINVALQAIVDADVALPVATPQPQKWSAVEIADACVKAGLGILECNGLMVTLKAALPVAAQTETADRVRLDVQSIDTPEFRKICGAYLWAPQSKLDDAYDAIYQHVDEKTADLAHSWKAGQVAAPQQNDPTAASAGELFYLDTLADACVDAEISDSKYESLCIALRAAAKGAAGQVAAPGLAQDKTDALLPAGWTVERSDKKPFRSITVKSPDGKVALLSNLGRNPENVFFEFAVAILATKEQNQKGGAA